MGCDTMLLLLWWKWASPPGPLVKVYPVRRQEVFFCREADWEPPDSDATGIYSVTPLGRVVTQDRDYCWEPDSFQLVDWSKFTQHRRKRCLTPVRLLATAYNWTLYNIGRFQKVNGGVFFTPQQRPILKIQICSVIIN